MNGIPLGRVDWWSIRPGPLDPPDPEACTCWWTRGDDGQAECGDDSCRCHEHCEQETPMSKWRGLHNPDWHDSVGVRAWCRCGTWCSESAECDCCELVELRAEVERLTAANEVLVVISVKAGKGMAQLTDQVDAVRRVLAESQTGIVAELREQIEAALRGEDEWTIEAERGES
jgi:hypothetical protein